MRVLLACLTLASLATGCERITHDMADQPRYGPAMSSPQFDNTNSARPPVAGTVAYARGDVAAMSGARSDGAARTSRSPDVVRGRERYAIYCLPCHGAEGAGDGEVVKRGFPAPLPFAATVPAASDEHLRDAILQGTGRMYPFADRVTPEDAASIVAYLRTLPAVAKKGGA